MTIKPWLDKAGTYPVAHIPCPNFASSPVDLTAPRAGILHTTEGPWGASMGVFHVHYAPHLLVGVNAQHVADKRVAEAHAVMGKAPPPPPEPTGRAEIAQLVPFGIIGAACRAHNALAIAEIEVVGYSREEPWIFEAGTLDALANAMLALRDGYGIPLSHPWPDGDYGRAGDNPHRHAGKLGKVAGWYGHGDMPAPDTHWDPGNLQWSKVFAHAHALDAKPSSVPVA